MADVPAAEEPYVGPRPFERTAEDRARFFGRDEETAEIVSLVMGHPAVLVYAQSGAGKTSLFNARIAPRLEEKGFQVLPLTRVRRAVPPGVDAAEVANLYMYCALLILAPDEDPAALVSRSLPDFLAGQPRPTTPAGRPMPRVIIFDQFEELFGFYPKDWRKQQDDFFQQVADALAADPLLRVVFVIREDYLAQLDPFVEFLPEELRVRFRVERLREPDALLAVTGPLTGTGRSFSPGAAEELVHELLQARVLGPDGQPAQVEGQYIEPVQLQVVCLSLWNNLPPGTTEITHEQLEKFGDVDQALARFYLDSLKQAVKESGVSETTLRNWFTEALITPASTRGTVFRGPADTAGIPNAAVDVLDRQHIIRREERAGAGWYELTHDRFIEPIQASNADWNRTRSRKLITWAIVAAGIAALVLFSGLLFSGGSVLLRANATAEAKATAAAEGALAISNQLAAQAQAQGQTTSVDLAFLLGAEALRSADTQAARQAVQNLLQSWPGVRTYLYAHDAPVRSLAFSQDGRTLASGDDNGRLAVWSRLAEGQPISMTLDTGLGAIQAIAVGPDGRSLAAGTSDGHIRLLEAEGRPLRPLDAHDDSITGLTFSPDGRFLASASFDGRTILWPLAGQRADFTVLEERAAPTTAVAFSPDGATLAAGGAALELLQLAGHPEFVKSAAYSPDGRQIVTSGGGGAVYIWDAETGLELGQLTGHTNTVNSAAYSPDGRRIVTASGHNPALRPPDDYTARVWDAETGRELRQLVGHAERVNSATYSPDGRRIVTASDDRTARIWDAETGQELRQLIGHTRGVNSAAYSPDGGRIVTAGDDRTARIWDAETGQELYQLIGHTRGVNSAAFSPDGKQIVTASLDGTARIWDTVTGQELRQLVDDASLIYSAAYSSDGRQIVTAGNDGAAHIWDPVTGQALRQLAGHAGTIYSAAYSPDGRQIVTAGSDSTARTWDAQSGWLVLWSDLATTQPLSHDLSVAMDATVTVAALAFDQQGGRLAMGFDDGQLAVWDLTSGELAFEPVDTGDLSVESLAFDPEEDALVALFADGSLNRYLLADLASGMQSPASWTRPVLGTQGAALTIDGSDWAIGLDTGAIMLGRADGHQTLDVNADAGALIAQACRIANRNLYPLEWNLFVGEGVPYRETCPTTAPAP